MGNMVFGILVGGYYILRKTGATVRVDSADPLSLRYTVHDIETRASRKVYADDLIGNGDITAIWQFKTQDEGHE